MQPTKGWTEYIDEVWKLIKLAYGLVESGRLWQICIEEWLSGFGFETIPGFPQLFFLRDDDKNRKLLLAKVVDDLLIARTIPELESFTAAIAERFEINLSNQDVIYNRLSISQAENSDVTFNTQEVYDDIEPIPLSRNLRKEQDALCTLEELRRLQCLAGKLNYVEHGILPAASLVASRLQQYVRDLRVSHICIANNALRLLKKQKAAISFQAPKEK